MGSTRHEGSLSILCIFFHFLHTLRVTLSTFGKCQPIQFSDMIRIWIFAFVKCPPLRFYFFSIFFWSFCLQSFLNSLFPVLLVTYSFVSAFSFCSSLDIFRPYICHCFILWLYTDLSLTMLLDCYDLHCLPLSLHWKEQLKPSVFH